MRITRCQFGKRERQLLEPSQPLTVTGPLFGHDQQIADLAGQAQRAAGSQLERGVLVPDGCRELIQRPMRARTSASERMQARSHFYRVHAISLARRHSGSHERRAGLLLSTAAVAS